MAMEVLPDTERDAVTASDPEPDMPESPADGTQLGRLRDRVEKARKERLLELEIPRTNIVGKYSPLPETKRRQIEDRFRKNKDHDVNLRISASFLAWCCEGLYDKTPEGLQPLPGLPDDVTWNSPELWEEIDAQNGPDAVMKLYYAEGDLIGHGQELMMFSGFVSTGLMEGLLGN